MVMYTPRVCFDYYSRAEGKSMESEFVSSLNS